MTEQQHAELLAAIRENTATLRLMLEHLVVLLDAIPVQDESEADESRYLDGSPR